MEIEKDIVRYVFSWSVKPLSTVKVFDDATTSSLVYSYLHEILLGTKCMFLHLNPQAQRPNRIFSRIV
jgi:hypothetical protein